MTHQLHHGDCLEVLRSMPDCSVDSIVTDPPYGLSFMGKKWDYDVPSVDVWVECLRVLKPGGHLLAFAGTRTQHRMAVRIEDAGFEIRDMIAWVYGSGFPKSLDVSKAIDKAAGAEREVVGKHKAPAKSIYTQTEVSLSPEVYITAPSTDAAKQWQGWGTALKPALEPITVARKPLIGTVAENVLQNGTGAINVDGGRVEGGRWPANFIHDGSEEVVGLFPQSNGGAFPKKSNIPTGKHYDGGWGAVDNKERTEMGSGSAARFFYCAKASKADRGENHHPTVKPTDLMRYLCRLVTPPNGIVLDPFNGSGSTGCAAVLEGFQYIGIEREAEYIAISEKRIQARSKQVQEQPKQLALL
jgi:DNA modification methylase